VHNLEMPSEEGARPAGDPESPQLKFEPASDW